MQGFRITSTRVESDCVVVSVFGEADLSAGPEFSRELTKAVETSPDLIVVDLEPTTFIDSTALRVLIQSRKRLEALGGQIRLVCPDRSIWKIFEITGLAEVFPRYPTVSDALLRATDAYAAGADLAWDDTHTNPDTRRETAPLPTRPAT